MKLIVDEIKEIKVVTADVESEFIHIDRLPDGTWRCVYTKNMQDKIVFGEPE